MTQPSPDPGTETRLVQIGDRQIVARQLNEMQMLLLAREAKRVAAPNASAEDRLTSAARIMDLMEAAVVQPEDVDYLTELTVAGKLSLADMSSFIKAFGAEDEKPRVRRGRPRKQPV